MEDILAREMEITAANLAALETRGIDRIRAAYLRDAACSLAFAARDAEESHPFYLGDLTRRLYLDHIRQTLPHRSDRITFAGLLAGLDGEPPFEIGAWQGGRIAYFPGAAAHEAYRLFSEALPDAAVTYPGDFAAVCEEVYDGLCDYCILPIANDAEGTLHRLRAMIDRYDLRIAMTCLVQSGDGESEFALLTREILSPADGKACLALSTAIPSPTDAAGIIDAAAANGLETLIAECMPTPSEDGTPVWDFRFVGNVTDFRGLLCYMSLEYPRYTPLGIFKAL